MKSKSKKSIKKIGKFFREVAVVVLGVAITLSVTVWINNQSIKRDVALNLNAIKMELEKNAIAFENYARRLHKSTLYSNYVKTHDEKSINQDSIRFYSQTNDYGIGWGEITSENILIKNAFEMLKTSGIMRYISDKELLESIWDIYGKMENVQNTLDALYQMKKEMRINELQLEAEGKRKVTVPLQLFYTLGASHAMEYKCKEVSEMIKETLSKL